MADVDLYRRSVLCVDDEVNVLRSLRRLLMSEDYELLTASSASEALTLLEERNVQVVISDQRMPESSGVELLQVVKQRHPASVRVVLSAYTDLGSISNRSGCRICCVACCTPSSSILRPCRTAMP